MSVLRFLRRRRELDPAEALEADVRDFAARIEELSIHFGARGDAAERARQRMRRGLTAAREASPIPAGRAQGWRGSAGTLVSRRRMSVAVALAAVMLLVTAGGLSVWDGEDLPLSSPSAEAVLIEGTFDSQSPDGLTLLTDSGSQVVVLDAGAEVVDAVGNPIGLDGLLKGQAISVRGRKDEHSGVVVSEVKAVSEIHGTVVSFSPALLRLTSSRGDFDLIVMPQTKVEGQVRPGVRVEVEIERAASGELIAKEIEAEDDEEEEGKDEHGAGPGPGTSPPAPPSTVVEVSLGEGPGTEPPASQPPSVALPTPTELPRSASAPASKPSGHDDEDHDSEDESHGPALPAPTPQPTPSGGGSDHEEECDPDEDDYEKDDEDDFCATS
jgi:hypothetical protein